MILAVDIGNTQITLGAFEGEGLGSIWRLATDARKTADEYGPLVRQCLDARDAGPVEGICVSSVVPALTPAFEDLARRYLRAPFLSIGHRTPLGLRLRVDNPAEVGADRIANALAARERVGVPSIVVDFGTATTFDCVSRAGDYLGGAILIGPRLASRALSSGTAQLPEVEIRRPARIVGRNTIECLQAGLYHGYLGMIERVLRESKKEIGGKVRVAATGGLADLYAPALRMRRVPDLTLHGLRIAWETVGRRGRRKGAL